MKRLGFLTGAVLAGIGVFLFNQWRHVSDDDRLTEVLVNHCLPYVLTGAPPFQTLGRTPGVHDDVEPNDRLTDGGTGLLYDLRFVARWVHSFDEDGPVRICRVEPSYGEGTVAFFSVDTDDFIERYTDVISEYAPLSPQSVPIGETPTVIGWYGADRTSSEGLRLVMSASSGAVSGLLVGTDMNTE